MKKVMKIYVKTLNPVLVIDRSRKDWEMNGNKGTVYTALCHQKYGDEVQVEKIRVTKEVYDILEPMEHYFFDASVDIRNNKMEVYNAFKDTAVSTSVSTSGSTSGSKSK